MLWTIIESVVQYYASTSRLRCAIFCRPPPGRLADRSARPSTSPKRSSRVAQPNRADQRPRAVLTFRPQVPERSPVGPPGWGFCLAERVLREVQGFVPVGTSVAPFGFVQKGVSRQVLELRQP